jgi:branched-subunit amino acid ABC-type transport system permease component
MNEIFAAVLVEGFLVGGRLALFAAGFTILFGGLRMPFVAYGQVILIGAYGVWTANAVLQQSYFAAAAIALIVLFPALVLSERLLFRQWYLHPYPVIVYLILTIGLTQILSNSIELLYTVDPRTLFTPYLYERISILGVRITMAQLMSLVITYIILFAIALLISYTRFGRALRAMVQDRETAMLMGVDIVRLSRNAYLLAMMLGIVGGMTFTLVSSFSPDLAPDLAGILFVTVLVGGAGSIFGSTLIGLAFGMTQAAAPLFMPPYLVDLSIYCLLFLILLLKPEGLFTR